MKISTRKLKTQRLEGWHLEGAGMGSKGLPLNYCAILQVTRSVEQGSGEGKGLGLGLVEKVKGKNAEGSSAWESANVASIMSQGSVRDFPPKEGDSRGPGSSR